jgi:hypothetical protein
MNAIDDQLRETLISREASSGDAPLEAIFVGYDKVIRPCASQKIRVASTLVLKSHYRLLPTGFQAGFKSNIGRTIQRIDQLLKELLKPIRKKDFAKLPKDIALEIIDLIRSTYLYEERYDNLDYTWNEQDMKGAIEYASSQSGEDYIYCLHRTDRNISRYRDNGNFTNAPDTGSIDLRPSRELAETIPVLMLIRQNGDKAQGWNDCPFYWPVLVLPRELTPVIFTYGAKESKLLPQREQMYERDLMKNIKGIKEEEILRLTLASEFFFDIILGNKEVECRDITETTASRYLVADATNSFGYRLCDGIKPELVKTGIFDQVNGTFPFAVRPHRYLLFRNSRDSSGSLLLVELDNKEPYYLECDTAFEEDVLLRSDFREVELTDELRLWRICYRIKRVVSSLLSKGDERLLKNYRKQLEESD